MFYLFLPNKTEVRDIIYAKLTAFVLVFSVLFSGMPVPVFAEESSGDVQPQIIEELPAVEGLTLIETGDAISEVDVVNTMNTNNTDISTNADGAEDDFFGNSTSTTEDLETEEVLDTQTSSTTPDTTFVEVSGSSTEDILDESVSVESDGNKRLDIEVINDNVVVLENNATSTAQTGENNSSDNDGNALIVTGDAIASANIINTVNTNILNSEGFLMFLNSFSGGLDLRDSAYWDLLGQNNANAFNNDCDLDSCNNANLFSSNDNTAEIVNNITVGASTGGNTASNNNNSAILTGNAYASANVVNIANTNIINSNYLLITANNFGSLSGDIIFPTAEEFSRLFFGGGVASTVPTLNVTNNNVATITNDVGAVANSGENSASRNGEGAFIMTGNSSAGSNIVNQINQNITNTASFSFLLRVHGNWSGLVYGAPKELMWTETSDGVAIFSNPNFSGSTNGVGALNVQNNNNAAITNNVNVYALTGENNANGNGGYGDIMSGNAYASANVVNVANTNIIGQNWTLAIINIFGDWNGNVSFGQPDLWVGGQVDTGGKTRVEVSDTVVYHYTIINNSDTIATKVHVVERPSGHIMFSNSQSGGRLEGGKVVWEIGDLVSGASAEVEYTAYVKGSLPVANTLLENQVTVASGGTDANMEDNTDTVAIKGYRRPPYLSSWSDNPFSGAIEVTSDPILSIIKTNNTTTALFASTTVDYTIIIQNNGGEAYDAILFDTLRDEGDNIVNEQYWNLDTIFPDEEITIEYSIVYDENTVPGLYTNYAQVEAIAGNPSLESNGRIVLSSVASSSISIAASIIPGSDFEKLPLEPVLIIENENDNDETQEDLPILKLNNKKIPEIIKRKTSIGYIILSLIVGDMYTPVSGNFSVKQEEKDQEVISAVGILNKLGGFAFMGSSGVQISSFKSLTDGKKGVSSSNHAPYDQLASIFDSFMKMWVIPYSWMFILALLGFTLTLLARTRTNISQ